MRRKGLQNRGIRMSICALAWLAAIGQNIELDRPLQPESAMMWSGPSIPQASFDAGHPTGEGWVELEVPLTQKELAQGDWLALSVKAERSGCMMLTCAGHEMLVCNEINHPADPGALGAMMWPAPMREGSNWIFIQGAGERLLTSFRPVSADFASPLHITQYDRTIPQAMDLVETDALGAMVVTNLTNEPIEDVNLWARCTFTPNEKYVGRLYPEDWRPGDWTEGKSQTIPPWGIAKMRISLKGPPPFKRDPQPYPFELEARVNGDPIAQAFVNLAVRESADRTWYTYESSIDGSIQRWIHIPATSESTQKRLPALFVLPHIQQSPQNHALGFEPSADHHIIVCWGRRPSADAHKYALHLESLLETIKVATEKHNIDPTRVGLLGFGDAGLSAFALQTMHPKAFTGIGVVSCFPPVDRTTGAESPLAKLPGRLAMRWGSECQSAPPDVERRYEVFSQDDQLLIDIVPGEGEWWGREAVDNSELHTWILKNRANLRTAEPSEVVLEGDHKELWSSFDASHTGL